MANLPSWATEPGRPGWLIDERQAWRMIDGKSIACPGAGNTAMRIVASWMHLQYMRLHSQYDTPQTKFIEQCGLTFSR